MNTKLVYVLTCNPESTYIEQALMAIWSARYWNPNAHIALMTDDQTNGLLVGKRAELLNYISEKVVVPFENSESMMYRSRFIKTQVREFIKGDFLFIDCDTIVCKSLADIDNWNIEIGAVYESHLLISEFCDDLYKSAYDANIKLGTDLSKEKEYFSSGIMLVKDVPKAHKLYTLWHQYWLESASLGLSIDQPALCKANISENHIITKIPDSYNTILFTKCDFTRQAHILHITSYRNPCFLFFPDTLNYVKGNGIKNEWLQDCIIKPCSTFLPFDFDILKSKLLERIIWAGQLSRNINNYGRIVDSSFSNIFSQSRLYPTLIFLCQKGLTFPAIVIWMLWKRWQVKYQKAVVSNNICKREN